MVANLTNDGKMASYADYVVNRSIPEPDDAPVPIVHEDRISADRRIFPLKSKGKLFAVLALGKHGAKNIFPYEIQSVTVT